MHVPRLETKARLATLSAGRELKTFSFGPTSSSSAYASALAQASSQVRAAEQASPPMRRIHPVSPCQFCIGSASLLSVLKAGPMRLCATSNYISCSGMPTLDVMLVLPPMQNQWNPFFNTLGNSFNQNPTPSPPPTLREGVLRKQQVGLLRECTAELCCLPADDAGIVLHVIMDVVVLADLQPKLRHWLSLREVAPHNLGPIVILCLPTDLQPSVLGGYGLQPSSSSASAQAFANANSGGGFPFGGGSSQATAIANANANSGGFFPFGGSSAQANAQASAFAGGR
ncbi:hypothetical protein QJQ45_009465 [Haematococcus lacustris]|nr:hypothetical protein QJQ45_009465 [Haematococcus lacustris]